MSSATASSMAVPGQRLAALGPLTAGHGTYAQDGGIFASILGTWSVSQNEVTVVRQGKTIGTAQVLQLRDTVVCRVIKATSRQVVVDILCVGDTVLQEAFPGTIRREDVRTHDLDKLVLEDMFAPGALVNALVLSFGDARSYFLSTAKAGLGVIQIQQQGDSEAADMETD